MYENLHTVSFGKAAVPIWHTGRFAAYLFAVAATLVGCIAILRGEKEVHSLQLQVRASRRTASRSPLRSWGVLRFCVGDKF